MKSTRSTELTDEKLRELSEAARRVAQNAFNRLSGFAVGAAILTTGGRVFLGCNIEFDNYSNTIHAEESAIAAMISAGERNPLAIAVYTSGKTISFPCGMCLQSLGELGGPGLTIIGLIDNEFEILTLSDLLPRMFKL